MPESSAMSIDPSMVRNVVEGALLAAGEPVSLERLVSLFEPDEGIDRDAVRAALGELQETCADRGVELREVASGWRMQVREGLAPWVSRLWEQRPPKYSRALLETLALVAYQQPVTRTDIEQVRGVSVSSNIIKTLLERDWIRIVGHRDVPGRPALYGTTRTFLDYFDLRSLDELPPLSELRDLDRINEEFGFDLEAPAGAGDAGEEASGAQVVPVSAVFGVSDADAAELDEDARDDGGDEDDEARSGGRTP